MNRYLEIKPNLYLVEQEIDNPQPNVNEASNHIWIYDRSGSMWGTLEAVVADLKQKAHILSKGDSLSLAWFSGEGDFRFVLKGFKITGDSDYKAIDKILDDNSSTRNTTCFSQVLEETEKTLKDLEVLGNFSLMLMTDGYPVVSNYNKEVEQILSVLKRLEGKVSTALLVGYGDYYNKSLMQEMAARIGGALVHAEDVPSFGVQIKEFIDTSREAGSRVKVVTPYTSPQEVYFSVNGKTIVSYTPTKGALTFVIGKAAKDHLFVLTDKLVGGEERVKSIDELGPRNSFVKGVYGLAASLSQRTETQLAVDVLGSVGDKALIDALQDSFTNSEYGRAERAIFGAMASPSERFSDGKVVGYVKPENAPCVLDVLDKVVSDQEAELFPYAGAGYSRIGAKAENKSEVTFKPADKGYEVSDLTWNGTRLNLSMQTRVEGTVTLDDRATKLNLQKEFNCYAYRNFTVIRDGILNMKRLTLKVSEATHQYLKDIGTTSEPWNKSSPMTYDFSVLPIMNRKIASGVKSVQPLCEMAIRESELEGIAKVLRGSVKAAAEQKGAPVTYSDKVVEYLTEFHIKDGIFSPPTAKVEATDYYMGKTFEIKIKGLSSLPKVTDVEAKVSSGKKLTTADNLVANGLSALKKVTAGISVEKAKVVAVQNELDTVKSELRTLRGQLMRQKFAVVMGKSWFDEFKGQRQEEYKYDHKGHEFTLKLGEVRVNY